MSEVLRQTPLHAEHVALGGRMVPFAGWSMPVQYAGVVAEHEAVRNAAGMFDVSHMGELLLKGEHALAVADYLVTNDVKKLVDGQALYTACCNERGTILDDLIVYRRKADEIVVVCNAGNRDKIVAHFRKACEAHCDFTDMSDETALIAVQGPRAHDVMRAAGASATTLGVATFHFADDRIADAPIVAARTGYTGEDGYELFVPANAAVQVWRALLESGRALGCVPAGLGARDTLRLEAKLALYGNDIDETTTPLEAGLGWVVKLDKGDFVGRAALVAQKAAGVPRKLAGIEMTGRGIARHGYPVVDASGADVGIVTSGSPGPTVKKNIGLAYVPPALAELGTKLGVRIRGSVIDAVVVKTPFYKRSH